MPTFSTSKQRYGGVAIDRSVFREKHPDGQWVLWAAGLVNAGDTNVATVSLEYQDDSNAFTSIGTVTHNTATTTKKTIGPVDLFAAAVNTEDVVVVRLCAIKDTGSDGTVECWNIWIEWRPPRQ